MGTSIKAWLADSVSGDLLLGARWLQDKYRALHDNSYCSQIKLEALYDDDSSSLSVRHETLGTELRLQITQLSPLTLADGKHRIRAFVRPVCAHYLTARYGGIHPRPNEKDLYQVIILRRYSLGYTHYGPPDHRLHLLLDEVDFELGPRLGQVLGRPRTLLSNPSIARSVEQLHQARKQGDTEYKCYKVNTDTPTMMPNHMNNRETQDTQEFGTQAPSLLRPVGTLATRGPMKATDGGPAGVRSGNGLLHLLKTGRNQGAQHPASYHQATGANAIEHSRHSSIRSGHAQKRHTSPTLAEPALSMASEPPNVSPSLRGGMLSSASDDSGEFADEANWKPGMSGYTDWSKVSSAKHCSAFTSFHADWSRGPPLLVSPTEDQRILLNQLSAFQKAPAGSKFTSGSVPIGIQKEIIERMQFLKMQEQMSTQDSSSSGQDDMPMPTLPSQQVLSPLSGVDDEDYMSWSSSPKQSPVRPMRTFPEPVLPPDSSLGQPSQSPVKTSLNAAPASSGSGRSHIKRGQHPPSEPQPTQSQSDNIIPSAFSQEPDAISTQTPARRSESLECNVATGSTFQVPSRLADMDGKGAQEYLFAPSPRRRSHTKVRNDINKEPPSSPPRPFNEEEDDMEVDIPRGLGEDHEMKQPPPHATPISSGAEESSSAPTLPPRGLGPVVQVKDTPYGKVQAPGLEDQNQGRSAQRSSGESTSIVAATYDQDILIQPGDPDFDRPLGTTKRLRPAGGARNRQPTRPETRSGYNHYKKTELKDLCRQRDINPHGLFKYGMIARLEEQDTQRSLKSREPDAAAYARRRQMMREIFGPFVDSPVITQLTSSDPRMTEEQLKSLAQIVITFPDARNDMEVMQRLMEQSEEQQQQPPSDDEMQDVQYFLGIGSPPMRMSRATAGHGQSPRLPRPSSVALQTEGGVAVNHQTGQPVSAYEERAQPGMASPQPQPGQSHVKRRSDISPPSRRDRKKQKLKTVDFRGFGGDLPLSRMTRDSDQEYEQIRSATMQESAETATGSGAQQEPVLEKSFGQGSLEKGLDELHVDDSSPAKLTTLPDVQLPSDQPVSAEVVSVDGDTDQLPLEPARLPLEHPEPTVKNQPEPTIENRAEPTLENLPKPATENRPELTIENQPEHRVEDQSGISVENQSECVVADQLPRSPTQPGQDNMTVLERFKYAYPQYTGCKDHFLNLCKEIYTKELDDRMVQRWLWDDYVIRDLTEYFDHRLDYLRRAEEPPSRLRWFKNHIRAPMYNKEILGSTEVLHQALVELGCDPPTLHPPEQASSRILFSSRDPFDGWSRSREMSLDSPPVPSPMPPPRKVRRSLPWEGPAATGSSSVRMSLPNMPQAGASGLVTSPPTKPVVRAKPAPRPDRSAGDRMSLPNIPRTDTSAPVSDAPAQPHPRPRPPRASTGSAHLSTHTESRKRNLSPNPTTSSDVRRTGSTGNAFRDAILRKQKEKREREAGESSAARPSNTGRQASLEL